MSWSPGSEFTCAFFSAPKLKAKVHYYTCSFVCGPSICRHYSLSSSTTFLQPQNEIQQNLTSNKISLSSTKFVCCGYIRKPRLLPWSLICWWIFDFSTASAEWKLPILDILTKFLFYAPIRKTDFHPGFWLAKTFSTSLQPLNGIQWNLTRGKISISSTKFCRSIGKPRWPPKPLMCWCICIYSVTAEQNWANLDWRQSFT